MPIDRCHCYQKTFEELRQIANETGAGSIESLQKHVTFGADCKLCHPYVRKMLETGQTGFHSVIRPVEKPANTDPD